jgi:hypothetical protein
MALEKKCILCMSSVISPNSSNELRVRGRGLLQVLSVALDS